MAKDLLLDFEKHLADLDVSPLAVRGYLADLRHFARWFEQANLKVCRRWRWRRCYS